MSLVRLAGAPWSARLRTGRVGNPATALNAWLRTERVGNPGTALNAWLRTGRVGTLALLISLAEDRTGGEPWHCCKRLAEDRTGGEPWHCSKPVSYTHLTLPTRSLV